MEQQSIGLKSLIDRIRSLENEIKHTDSKATFENDIINNLEKNKKEYTTSELNKIKKHYINGMTFESSEIFQLIEYTIRYIESNIIKIALLLNTNVSSNLKLQTALSLIKDIVANYSDTFLVQSINGLVKLIYNSDMKKLDISRSPDFKIVEVKQKQKRRFTFGKHDK